MIRILEILSELVCPTPDPVQTLGPAPSWMAQQQAMAQQQQTAGGIFGGPDTLGALFNSFALPQPRSSIVDEFWLLLGQLMALAAREREALTNNTKVTHEDLDHLRKAMNDVAQRAYEAVEVKK